MKFDDLDAYLAHYQTNKGPALIPIDTVAYYRDVNRTTALRMLEDGRLTGVDIEGEMFATVESYIALTRRENDRVENVRRIIEEHARKGEIVTYSSVMEPVGLNSGSPPDRKIIGRILGQISTVSYRSDGIFLSAIVHKKYGAGTKPGAGYFSLVEYITGEKLTGDEASAVEAAVKDVFTFYDNER